MSNLALTAAAQAYAEQHTKQFLKEYNSGELTDLGKREILRDLPMFAFMAGYAASDLGPVLERIYKLLNHMQNSYSNEEIEIGNGYLHHALQELEAHIPYDKFNLQLRDEYKLPESLHPETKETE